MKPVESKLLGQKVEYPKTYCPDILVAVPRNLNREIYDIHSPDSLFKGYDCWHAYEASFITQQGMPVTGLLKLVYPANSNFLVESKSLKLYLGSFNMYQLGADIREGIGLFCQIVKEDLQKLLQTSVDVVFHSKVSAFLPFDFNNYEILEYDSNLNRNLRFSIYQEHPAYLTEHPENSDKELRVGTHLLKSNCKITNQPDWGSLYIRFKGIRRPAKTDLLKYIVSIRNENHFHEEICEMIFKRLTDAYQPDILMVSCLYTRRGGIDICPVRANKSEYLPHFLPDAHLLTQKTFRQ